MYFKIFGLRVPSPGAAPVTGDKDYLSNLQFAENGDTLIDADGNTLTFSALGIQYGGPPDQYTMDPSETILWFDPSDEHLKSRTKHLDTEAIIDLDLSAAGSGDMLKSVYDSNDDGVVNAADQLTDGVNTVTAFTINSHIANGDIHAVLDDAFTTAINIWSASKIQSELDTKTDVGHIHDASDVISGTFDYQRLPVFTGTTPGAVPDATSYSAAYFLDASGFFSLVPVGSIEGLDVYEVETGDLLLYNGEEWQSTSLVTSGLIDAAYNTNTLTLTLNVPYTVTQSIAAPYSETALTSEKAVYDYVTSAIGGGSITTTFAELDDTDITYPQVAEIAVYDGENWSNTQLLSAGGTSLYYDANARTLTISSVAGYGDSNIAILDDLLDVHASSPSAGNALVYNGSAWVPDTVSTVGAFDDLTDVNTSGAQSGDTIVYNGSTWEPGTGGGSSDVQSMEDLDDVTLTYIENADMLIYYNGEWVNSTLTSSGAVDITYDPGTGVLTFSSDSGLYEHIEQYPATTWTVNHNLGSDQVLVQVYDENDQLVIPDSISITSENTVVITFTVATYGRAIVATGLIGSSEAGSVAGVTSVNGETGDVTLTTVESHESTYNHSQIAINTVAIADNASDIVLIEYDVAANTGDIATNTSDIATNTSDISTNTADIATNTSDIATNTSDIAANKEWVEISTSKYTSTPADTDTLTMSDTSDMAVGIPIRYTISGTVYYGQVVSITTDTSIDIVGASLSGSVTKLEIGRAHKIVTVPMYISGTYADGTDTDLLANDMTTYIKWRQGKAYLVSFSAVHDTVDSGTEPKVNVQINNAAVSTNDSNNGVQLSTAGTWVDNSAVAISTSNYDINWDEELEVACTAAGGTGDAEDLTVLCTFVLE